MPNQATHNFTKSWVMIGGTGIRADRWSVSRPAYGVIGGFTAETSSEVLTSANLDLYQLGQQAKGQIPVHIIVESPIYGSVTIFGGELDSVDWDFQTDTIRLAGRDWAGILADTKRVLMGNETIGAPYAATTRSSSVQAQPLGTKTPPGFSPFSSQTTFKSINVQNQTPSQLVTYIAERNGFKTTDSKGASTIISVAGEPLVGNIIGGLGVSAHSPHTEWGIVQFLARIMGWFCYVTPDRELYFGPPPTGQVPLHVSWNEIAVHESGVTWYPCKDLEITYNPRRNVSFIVIVASHHIGGLTVSKKYVAVPSGPMAKEVSVEFPDIVMNPNQFYIGESGSGVGVTADRMSSLFANFGKPVYLFYETNLTADGCQAAAYAKALDIAKRELLISFSIDGNPNVVPNQKIHTFNVAPYKDIQFYVNSVEHSFDMDQGWWTHVHGWTLPPGMENGQLLSQAGIT